jgi:hypothetical protein
MSLLIKKKYIKKSKKNYKCKYMKKKKIEAGWSAWPPHAWGGSNFFTFMSYHNTFFKQKIKNKKILQNKLINTP